MGELKNRCINKEDKNKVLQICDGVCCRCFFCPHRLPQDSLKKDENQPKLRRFLYFFFQVLDFLCYNLVFILYIHDQQFPHHCQRKNGEMGKAYELDRSLQISSMESSHHAIHQLSHVVAAHSDVLRQERQCFYKIIRTNFLGAELCGCGQSSQNWESHILGQALPFKGDKNWQVHVPSELK